MQQAEVPFWEAVYSKGDKCDGDSEQDKREATVISVSLSLTACLILVLVAAILTLGRCPEALFPAPASW